MAIKDSKVVQFFYNLRGVKTTYHFLWAWAGEVFAKSPSKEIVVIGITGTKGKTTTLELVNAILEAAGKKTALISSLRIKVGDDSTKNPIGNSMPGHGYLQRFLHRAVRANCQYALIEVTSQGVEAHRHRFIHWNIGAITNLAPEHIEAHGSFEKYRKAKLDFLEYVIKGGGKVFLNRDDRNFGFFEEALAGGRKKYTASAERTASSSRMDEAIKKYFPKGSSLPGSTTEGGAERKFLLSEFNEENMAIAIAIAKEIGVDDAAIDEGLRDFPGVPGRVEFVRVGAYTAVVDYAHTPDSLRAAYKAVKPKPTEQYPHPRLICVLGAAGGGRDRWKRPQMGAIAGEYCDEIILTDEDPYDENPLAIVNEIRSGILKTEFPAEHLHEDMDRKRAIGKAVALAREGDVVIGTGKGSEDWVHAAGGKKISWNERAVFEEALLQKKEKPHSSEEE